MKTTEPVEVVPPPFALVNAEITRECPLLPKLRVRVRFSSPAPCETPRSSTRGFFVV